MKKITTNTLSRILSVLPELNRVEQLHVLGGTSETESGVTGYYSFDTMLDLIGRGDWTGGCVEGIGYIGEEASTYQTGCYTYEAMLREMYYGTWAGGWVDHSGYVKGDVTMTGYYTLVDMEKMITEGTWNGGYVEDFGYVEAEGITGNYSTGIYSEQEMVDQMFSNEWKGGWVNGEYLDADYVVTGMYRTADEILEAMCYGNWYGGWLENSGYIGDNITGYAGNRVYSSSEMSDMQNNGLWSGGWVFGSGYINGGDGSYEDGITGAYDSDGRPVTGAWYTIEEMCEMVYGNTWKGGLINNIGYVEEVEIVTGCYQTGVFLDDGTPLNYVGWDILKNMGIGLDVLETLTDGAIQGLGNVATVLGGIDLIHGAVVLYQDDQATAYNLEEFAVDLMWSAGGIAGSAACIAWKVVDYETEELQEQAGTYLINMENGMGKDGNYSFFKFNSGW